MTRIYPNMQKTKIKNFIKTTNYHFYSKSYETCESLRIQISDLISWSYVMDSFRTLLYFTMNNENPYLVFVYYIINLSTIIIFNLFNMLDNIKNDTSLHYLLRPGAQNNITRARTPNNTHEQ